MRTLLRVGPLAAFIVLAGCDGLTYTLPDLPPPTPSPVAARFDPTICGTITGRVTWAGDRPAVPPVHVPTFTLTGVPTGELPHPNAPVIDPATGGVRSAVVFLRGVDPAAAKPWDHPPAEVEIDDTTIRVRQGHDTGRIGFVRTGEAVRFRSTASAIAGIRARGAAFFTLMFPPDGMPVERTLGREGRVELTTASGQFWAAADLFVAPHPYFARPGADGRFRFADVPAGTYELVVWHPNWHPARMERDPETGAPTRRWYAPPTEKVQIVTVTPGGQTDAAVTLTTADFPPGENHK